MISFPERVTICRLSMSADVTRASVEVEAPDWAHARIGVGWRMVRLTPFEGGEPREGRILVRWGIFNEGIFEGSSARNGLRFIRPLHHVIHAAAPGDYVIPDEPGPYGVGW